MGRSPTGSRPDQDLRLLAGTTSRPGYPHPKMRVWPRIWPEPESVFWSASVIFGALARQKIEIFKISKRAAP